MSRISALSERDGKGHRAQSPAQIPGQGWKEILQRVRSDIAEDHISVVAAGVAFYALIAIFPAIAALISISGLILDPADVAAQLDRLAALLPESAATIINQQVVKVTGGGETTTGLLAGLGLLIALYGTMKGVLTLIEGLNIAYDEQEQRGLIRLYATAAALTLFLIVGVLLAIGLVTIVPVIARFGGVSEALQPVVTGIGWLILALAMMLGLAVIYRFAPSRANPKWRWVSVGAGLATLIWIAGTLAFSVYVRNFGSYTETYGALGGVVILLTWLWLSAFVILAGAELNAEIEQQTARDTTTGAPVPMGQRGAVKADTPPPGQQAGLAIATPASGGTPDKPRAMVRPGAELALAAALAARALWRIARRSG
jgi:membrane protein